MRTVLVVALCLSAVTLGAQPPELPPAPGKLVDIGGGRRLHMLCSGSGAPTVILEAGASSFAIDWTLVQRDVARTTRVCSYDRAGMGWSDPDPRVSRSSAVDDLHKLLTASGERAPFVLVGASRGGLFVRAYQADHPASVAGLVFVDPSTEDRLFTIVDGRAALIATVSAEQLRTTLPTRTVPVPRRSPQTGAPFDRLPPELYQTRIKLDQRLIASFPDSVTPDIVERSAESERALLARLLDLRNRTPHPLGALPIVVLTRGNDRNEDREAAQRRVAAQSTNSRHTVVDGAGHEIHLFAPAVVVQAIEDVVHAVRSRGPLVRR